MVKLPAIGQLSIRAEIVNGPVMITPFRTSHGSILAHFAKIGMPVCWHMHEFAGSAD
jgi:hypothetical protein